MEAFSIFGAAENSTQNGTEEILSSIDFSGSSWQIDDIKPNFQSDESYNYGAENLEVKIRNTIHLKMSLNIRIFQQLFRILKNLK